MTGQLSFRAVGKTVGEKEFRALLIRALTLRVQGFYIRNCNYGFGYTPSIWVLGPLGLLGCKVQVALFR